MGTISITPGYDFGTTEVPTNAKFKQAANGIQITGVQLQNVDQALVASYGGEVSGTTGASLPGEGYMWVDPAGNTWIETIGGPVRINRNDGGFESKRWDINTRAAGFIDPRGFACEVEGAGGSENSLRFRSIQRSVLGGTGYVLGVCPDTSFSGPQRVVGKGVVEVEGGFTRSTGTNFWKLLFWSNAPAAQLWSTGGADVAAYWQHYGYDSAGLDIAAAGEWWSGLCLGPDSGTSHYSDGASGVEVGDAYALCYFYGTDIPLRN
jgi:hypothetical protein